MSVDKFAVSGLLLIILIGVLVPYATSAPVYAGNNDVMKKLVAEKVVNMVRNRITGLLNLADSHGITIPDNLTDNVDQALALLDEASSKVDTQPKEAIRLSIKASLVFAPVARYIVKNLPEGAISEVMDKRLEKAIEVKLALVNRLNETLNWLRDKGIPFNEEASNLVNDAYNLLMQAKDLLESGNYNTSDVAHLIGEASMKLGLATKTLYGSLHRDWVKVNIIAHAGFQMHTNLKSLVWILNSTIDSLESGSANITETSEKLRDIANALSRVADIIDSHMGGVPPDSNLSKAMQIIRDALYDVSSLLNQAADSLDNGDVNGAIAILETAINELVSAAEEAGQYLPSIRSKIIKLREILPQMMDKLRSKLEIFIANKMGNLVYFVGLMDASLHAAYRRYQQGHLSKDSLLHILDRAENILTTMLNRLNNMKHPPQFIIQKINNILDWIHSVESELQS